MLSQNLDIPDLFEDQFTEMTKTLSGFLGICIVGPIMEEIMMRRVIMTEISKATGHVWWGIIISAAIFAVIHGNPIQIVFALPAGIIFGWLYYKTGSLTVPISIHIINNTISFLTLKYSLDFKINISTTLGVTVFLVLVIITLCSIVWLNRFYSGKEEVKEQ
jgi:membrane protease YdiL (CAAX protease family)